MTSLLFGTAIATSSTGFFLCVILLYSYLCYSIRMRKNKYIKELVILSILPISFACVYNSIFFYIFLVLYAVCFVLIYFKYDETIENFINKYLRFIIILIPLIISTYSLFYVTDLKSSIAAFTGFNEFFDHSPHLFEFNIFSKDVYLAIFNVIYWCLITAFVFSKNYELKLIRFFIFCILITFFNPFCYGAIYKFLTNEVYFRISDLIFNPLILL